MTITLEQAKMYYVSKKGLQRLFKKIIEKYESYGDFKGTIKIISPSSIEEEEISDFMGKNYTELSHINIKIKDVIKAHQSTVFERIDFLQILEALEQRKIIPKKELQKKRNKEQEQILNQTKRQFADSLWCQTWLQAVEVKDPRTRSLWRTYNEQQTFLDILNTVCAALETLEKNQGKIQHIAVFACQVASDPHAFDLSGEKSLVAQPFYQALCILAKEKEKEQMYQFQPEYIHNLYLQFGLMKESILNYLNCKGIIAFDSEGHPLPTWEVTCQSNSIYTASLYEMMKVESAKPYGDYSEIYIVENPSIFSSLVSLLKINDLPLLCTAGHFNLSSIRLLKLLVDNDTTLYYSGDFDPEGLTMAQKLLTSFPGKVRLWRLSEDDYLNGLNQRSKKIEPSQRINQLSQIKHPSLISLAEKMKNYKLAVFQEQILDKLIQDLERKFS